MWILAKIIAVITRRSRSKIILGINFEWSSKSWTHNIFRAYELVFWRQNGKNGVGDTIRAEISTHNDFITGKVHQYAHSFEACFAIAETYIRDYLASWKFVPFKIYIPMIYTPAGVPIPSSPYLFAIAFDAVSNPAGSSSPYSGAHTVTGSNPILWSGLRLAGGADPGTTPLTFTYALTAMTATSSSPANNGNGNLVHIWVYGLGNPNTGTNNIDVTLSTLDGIDVWSTSYSGAQSSSTPDSTTKTENSSAVTNLTLTTTVVASNCWLFGNFRCEIGSGSAGTGLTLRYNNTDGGVGDSNGTVGTGAQSMTYNHGSAKNEGVIVSFAPFTAPAATSSVTPTLSFLGAG